MTRLGATQHMNESIPPPSEVLNDVQLCNLEEVQPCVLRDKMLVPRVECIFMMPRTILLLRVVRERQFFALIIELMKLKYAR